MTTARTIRAENNMPVDRCVCFNVPFTVLKEYAIEHSCGMDGLRDKFGCGRGCALCVPYIQAMLRSGRTSFDPAVPPDEQSPISS